MHIGRWASQPGAYSAITMKLLVIGHSHLDAVRAAAERHASAYAAAGLALRFIQLREPRFVDDASRDDDDIGQALLAEVARQADGCDASLLMVGGNAHNGLGLFEHPEPFDFVPDDDPDGPLDPSRTLIPAPLLAAHFRQNEPYARPARQRARLLTLLPPARGQTDSPPPIADTATVQALLPDAHRRSARALHGLSPAHLRLKVWRLHGAVLREDCAKLGLRALPAPAGTQDTQGGLATAFHGRDAIHANADYGHRVLEEALA